MSGTAETRVVNVRCESCDVYIGRDCGRWRDAGFGNPFKIRPGLSCKAVIAKYIAWILAPEQKALRERVRRELRGKVLGCWCKPLACHGDVLAKIADGEIAAVEDIPYTPPDEQFVD